jgi:ATP-dependent DNA ligase
VSKRLGSPYVSDRTRHWLKFKNPEAPAVKREAEEEWERDGYSIATAAKSGCG